MKLLDELKALKRIAEVSLYSAFGVTALFITFSVITGSVSLLTYFIWAAAAILVKIFALVSIRVMLKENQFLFPYGTGKIENFSSFFFGFMIVPLGIYFLILSLGRLISPQPGITYLLCQVPIAISFLRSLLLTIWTRRIIKGTTNPSPLLKAYYTDFKVALTSDSFLFLAFLSGYLLSTGGFDYLSIRVDPLLSVILSLYMLRVGVPLIIENTRSLIDLPLPEKEMLKILKVTTEFYREFTGFGMLYSRQSGKRKIVEMELSFSPAISLEQITEIENRIDKRINQEIPDVCFRIIPKISSCDEK